ncbi:MAG: TIGR02186 family protein [Alphaproteobacteria bacterium]|nr:TIGR02186 family protein [Alphaproteobacteria bacterium]
MTRVLLVFVLAVGLAPAARAQPALTADLSAHRITLSSESPTTVTLFGTVDAPGDIVVVVRGPEADAIVRHGPLGNFWLTAHSVAFGGVPGFYAVYASAPLDAIVPRDVRALHQIGLDNLRFELQSGGEDPAVAQQYRADLVAERERAGLYAAAVGKVTFVGGRLFRTTLELPGDAPAGNYFIEVLLLHDKKLIGGQTMSLAVSGGTSIAVGAIAGWTLALYGALAALAVAVTGGLALRLRRRRVPEVAAAPDKPLRPASPPSAKRARRR